MSVDLDIQVCIDCTMAIANDDYTGMDLTQETAVRSGLQRWADDGFSLHIGDTYTEFSRWRCDVCLTDLAGHRHQAWASERPAPGATPVPPAAPGSRVG